MSAPGASSSSAVRNFSHGGVAPRSSTLASRIESHSRQRTWPAPSSLMWSFITRRSTRGLPAPARRATTRSFVRSLRSDRREVPSRARFALSSCPVRSLATHRFSAARKRGLPRCRERRRSVGALRRRLPVVPYRRCKSRLCPPAPSRPVRMRRRRRRHRRSPGGGSVAKDRGDFAGEQCATEDGDDTGFTVRILPWPVYIRQRKADLRHAVHLRIRAHVHLACEFGYCVRRNRIGADRLVYGQALRRAVPRTARRGVDDLA